MKKIFLLIAVFSMYVFAAFAAEPEFYKHKYWGAPGSDRRPAFCNDCHGNNNASPVSYKVCYDCHDPIDMKPSKKSETSHTGKTWESTCNSCHIEHVE